MRAKKMERDYGSGSVGQQPANQVSQLGKYCSGNQAKSIQNSVAVKPKPTGYKKIGNAVSG